MCIDGVSIPHAGPDQHRVVGLNTSTKAASSAWIVHHQQRYPLCAIDSLAFCNTSRLCSALFLGSSSHLCLCVRVSRLNHVVLICFCIRLRRLARRKGLLKVRNDVVNVFGADRDTDEVFRDTAIPLLLVAELLMRRRPGVNS